MLETFQGYYYLSTKQESARDKEKKSKLIGILSTQIAHEM